MTEKNVLRPQSKVKKYKNVIFLAGPIQGAPDWHKDAIETIQKIYKENVDYKIACPKNIDGIVKSKDFNYDLQVDWECFYLDRASINGVILFWLAKEEVHDPERAYAQTSRYELAEWITKHQQNNNIQIVVGIEPGFSGERYIRKRIKKDAPKIKVYDNLLETCTQSVTIN